MQPTCITHLIMNWRPAAVFSGQLEWLPAGSELPDETRTVFSGSQDSVLPDGAGVVESDILLAKMRPGQSIELEAHAVKGMLTKESARDLGSARGKLGS